MTRQEFLKAMHHHLRRVDPRERDSILAEFDQHFHEGLARGQSEEVIAARLGQPRALAASYLTEIYAKRLVSSRSPWAYARNAMRFLLALAALGLFNAFVVALPFCLATASLLAAWCMLPSMPIILGGLVLYLVVYAMGTDTAVGLFGLGGGLVGGGLILLGLGVTYALTLATVLVAKLGARYVSLNLNILKRVAP